MRSKFFALLFSLRCHILLLLCVFPAFAQNIADMAWRYHSTSTCVIAYREADKMLALGVLGEVQERRQQLSQRLGYQPRRVITVFLCPTQEIFDHMTGGVVPHWGEAAANTAQWRIFLKTPAAHPEKRGALLPVTVTHELAHLCLAELAQPSILPRWFNEGAAILLSNEPRHTDPVIISRAILTNSLVDFEEIDDLLSFPNARAALAYAESYQAVSFLTRRFGPEAIAKLARTFAVHGDSRQAFQVAFNQDLWDFETAYFDDLRRRFRWYFFLDETFVFGGVILILVIAGFFVTRWRMKKKIQEWEKDEAENDGGLLPEVDDTPYK
ncbi:MAG: peptidase MA family metallohydrolase [candidate division KSB1 bacterium]|nr:peptidase MA family metallohydrolase [candidate division KSB1 bacterium]